MWLRAHARPPSLEELQVCFRLKSFHKTSRSYYPYSTEGRMLKKEYKGKSWASWWFFLGDTWEALVSESA